MEGSRESQGDRLMPMTFDWLASDGGALDHRLASPAAAARTAAPRIPEVRTTTISRRRFLGTVAAVAPDVSSVAGLKGKAIGVTRVGATTWIFARMLAKKEGWDPDKDVQIVGLGGLDAQLAALARREIAAYVWGDGGAVTELQGKSKVLLRFDAVTGKWISQIQYASEDAITHQADPIRRSLRALFTALKLMRESPREAALICAQKLGWSPEAVLRAHKISGPLLPVDGRIDVAALAVMQGTLLEYDVIKKKLPLEDHFTREFTPVRV